MLDVVLPDATRGSLFHRDRNENRIFASAQYDDSLFPYHLVRSGVYLFRALVGSRFPLRFPSDCAGFLPSSQLLLLLLLPSHMHLTA